MNFFLYLFGFLPSIIWLAYYLTKDKHPESNKMVLKIFVFGMLSGFAAIVLEKGFQWLAEVIRMEQLLKPFIFGLINIFLGGALVEELVKYWAIRIGVFHSPELDEPVDFMIYMIIAGLGFAALENILVLINQYYPFITPVATIETMGTRFLSATFLHAVCSGVLGYFLALSFLSFKKRRYLFYLGLGLATLLHGDYNYAIMELRNSAQFLVPIAILVGAAIFVSYGLQKIKKSKAFCEI